MGKNQGEFHIGALIDKRIEEVGMSKAEFGRRINTSRQNVNTLLRKGDLGAAQLLQISCVLNCNFFDYYVDQLPKSLRKQPDSLSKETGIRVQIELSSADDLQEFEQWWREREAAN